MSQKDKYLNSAQKFIQKGQLERAIKDYEQVVAADPKDVRHRQKLAELLARCNRGEDACREYETIARYYEDNGFYLKAIAVYKQVQKLSCGKIEISLTLAGLNEKLGLVGNALSEYKCAFDHYTKEGLSDAARGVLEKMHSVDPENVDILLKLAETHLSAGQRDDAYREYTTAANIFKSRGNENAFERVFERIISQFPEKQDLKTDLLEDQIAKGTAGDIMPALKQMLEKDEKNLKLLSLYAEACGSCGDKAGRKSAFERMVGYFPAETSAIEGLIECIAEEGDLEEGVRLLGIYSSDLLSAGRFVSLEKIYTTLQNQAPYDTRILQGLKSLYETSGDHSKLADVQVSLNILSTDDSAEQSLFDVIAENEDDSAREESGDSKFDLSWDDEIDLTVSAQISEDSLFTENIHEELDLTGDVIHGDQEEAADGDGIELHPLSLEEITADSEIPATVEPAASAHLGELTEKSFADSQQVENLSEDVEENDQNEVLLSIDLDESLFEIEFDEGDETGAELESVKVEQDSGDEIIPEVEEICALEEIAVVSDGTSDADLSMESGGGPDADVPSVIDFSATDKHGEDFDTAGGILADFKDKIDSQLDRDDTETHFNLGIAYKEMGLYDEAINEFTVASADPLRAADCVILQGICLGEKGETHKAEEVFQAGINRFSLDPEKTLNMKYELALLFENAGRKEEALQTYRAIFTINPSFRDTAEKMAKLHGSTGVPDFSDIDEFDFELKALK